MAMNRASEYRQHARECRELAASMEVAAHREQLIAMADAWDKMADERVALIERHPDERHRDGSRSCPG